MPARRTRPLPAYVSCGRILAAMSSKAALKAVKTALDSKDFEQAADKAKDLVEREPDNYNAYAITLSFPFFFFCRIRYC